jgi:hypothetical protein
LFAAASRKLWLAGIEALNSKHRDDVPLTLLPFKSGSVRVLTTAQELRQIGVRMKNCLWAPEWAVRTLLGRLRIAFVDMGDVQAVAELVPSGNLWTSGLILGEDNTRLDPVLDQRVRQHIMHEMRSEQPFSFERPAVSIPSDLIRLLLWP